MVNQKRPDIDGLIREKHFLEKEIETLGKISSLLALGDENQRIFSEMIKSALDLLDANNGSLMLLQDNSEALSIVASEGIPPEIMAATKVKVGEGIAGRVAKTGEPLILIEGSEDARLFDLRQAGKVKDALSVPVVFKEKIIGVLNVSNKKAGTFSEADIVPLMIFANQAAIILHEHRSRRAVDESYLSMVTTLAEAVDARDPYTFGHSKAVRDYSVEIGVRLGLDKEVLRRLDIAAVLHDLGKLSISDAVLLKTGSLTAEEYEMLKTHARIGARILRLVGYFTPVIPAILHHHEKYDGTGYPDGLKGEGIPLEARILAIADAFDSMSSKRVYRPLLRTDDILKELRKGRGRQFDPYVLDVFIRAFEIDRGIYRAGESRIGDDIHRAFNYYALAVRDNPVEVKETLEMMSSIVEAFLLTIDKYAGPLVKDRIKRKLNAYSIENRLDFVITDDRPDVSRLLPINLTELVKRFQAYLDYLLTITSAALSFKINALIIHDTSRRVDPAAAGLFRETLKAGHFAEQAA